MAGIDKIYGTSEDWWELCKWLAWHRPQYIKFLYPPIQKHDGNLASGWPVVGAISNFPQYADKWLYDNCPIKWVTDTIRKQYGLKPRDGD